MKCQDAQAKYVYDQFRISQPHIAEDGVWNLADTDIFFIVCPELSLDLKTMSGISIIDWFKNDLKPMCFNIKLVKDIPEGASRLTPRTVEQVAFHHGFPRNINDVIYNLYLYLPKDFPDFVLFEMPPKVTLLTEVDLTGEQVDILYSTSEKLGFPFEFDHKKEPNCLSRLSRGKYQPQRMSLIPSRKLNESQISDAFKKSYQEDEELWLDNKVPLLTAKESVPNFLEDGWTHLQDSCLVSSASFLPDNVRTYLSINEKVIYQMPLSSSPTEFLSSSGMTEQELLSLYEMGRINFVLSHSIERYPLSLLNKLTEINPKQLLLPRRLALQNIAEIKGRVPILIPPIDYSGKRLMLESVAQALKTLKNDVGRDILKLIINELSRIWLQIEQRVDSEGPMSSSSVGLGFLVGGLYRIISGRDLDIEFTTAATGVEWSCALRTNLIPANSNGFSNEVHSGILLSFYDGIPFRVPDLQDRTKIVAEGLLAISDHVSVVDFAKVINEGDLLRLRRLVFDGARGDISTEELKERVEELNKEIKSYENKEGIFRKVDLVGLGLDLVAKPPGFGWFTGLLDPYLESKRRQHPAYGALLDTLKGMRTFDKPHRPFVARLKENLRQKIQ